MFIDANRDDVVEGRKLGVEPICAVLREAGFQVAPSSYYAAKARPLSARTVRDGDLRPVPRRLWEGNYSVYGARKLWKAARRAGHDVGRDQVARLTRAEGIEGVRRTKRVRTTRPDPGMLRHPDLVERDFTATGPEQLWVTDLTFVATWAGVAYVCFIIDAYSRTIVGWRAASQMRTTTVRTRSRWPAGSAAPSSPAYGATPTPGRSALAALRRTARRDRGCALHRHRRRLLRLRASSRCCRAGLTLL